MVPDPVRFPEGIAGIASQIHTLGLKIGLYSSAGTETCAGYPASIGYEYLDAATFAEWGIDYLKYDNCHVPTNWKDEYIACVPDSTHGQKFPNGTCQDISKTAPADYDWSTSKTAERYRIMRNALHAQNRTILYSLCEWGRANVVSWGNKICHSWRMSGDITPY
jgi:alpha-galactosidase